MQKNQSKVNTIRDVAEQAGVSTATVSHVINSTKNISEETKNKVYEAINSLNYSPNALARGLRVNQTKLIGLIVPDITTEFYNCFAKGFIDSAYANGYTVALCGTQYDANREMMEVEALVERRVDGFVFVGGGFGDDLINRMIDRNIPVVLADRSINKQNVKTVQFDNYSAMRNLIQLLKEKGYSKIGYISETITMSNLADRFEGFKRGLNDQSLEYTKEYVHINDCFQLDKINNSYLFVKDLVEKGTELPQVFVTTSDLIAAGTITALKEKGFRIPEQIAVTGYDDIMIAQYLQPPLTTVFQDKTMMGIITWDLMQKILNDEYLAVHSINLEAKIVVRGSC
jgi:DNA-binding LacI/PurR family transcriptional regulator